VIALSSLKGQVVLLTFLYTRCPDACPLTAETIRSARDKLGDAAKDVALVAVSVDPIGDTPAAAKQFVAEHRLTGSLRYLVGSRDALARVWQAYGIAQANTSEAKTVLHTDVIYLVDRRQRARVVLHSDVTPDDLASDLLILVGER
jgi:protein SCO1/2